MRDTIVRRVHDVLGAGLDLKERLERGESPAFEYEYDRLRALVAGDGELAQMPGYTGEVVVGYGPATATGDLGRSDRLLGARYALACWLDEIFLSDSPQWWADRWEANTVETALYGGSSQRAWRFWDQARKAEGPRGSAEALEAYLWCVMLGFRGQPPSDLSPATWVDGVRKRLLARPGEFPAPPDRDLPFGVPALRGRERFTRMLRVAAVVGAAAAFAGGLAAAAQFAR